MQRGVRWIMVDKKYILAIDHGTSGAKTALVSVTGEVIDWAFQETPMIFGEGGLAEQDPAAWWDAIKATSKILIDKGHVHVEDIVGICDTSQWSCTVPVDKDGNHLMNAMSWMDTRGSKQIQALNKSLLQVSGYKLSLILKYIKVMGGGPSLSGKDPISHIMWLRDEKPDIYSHTHKFLDAQDFINFKFTGKMAASHASIHLCWVTDARDPGNIHYSNSLLKLARVDGSKFPELKRSIDVLGDVDPRVADELGLQKGTKVVLGAPDLHAAAIGSGAIGNYETHLCVGTSNWLICHTPKIGCDPNHNIGTIPSALPGKYLLANEQEIAGGALSFLRDKILYHKDELLVQERQPDVYKIFDKIVERIDPGSNGVIFTPWLYGERAPVADDTTRGGLFNLSMDVSREHIIRAIFEGIAYNVRWLQVYVEKFIKRKVDNVRIIGGGANSAIWCQIFADVMGCNILQVENPIQTNARGAALIAALGLGYIQEQDIPNCIKVARTFKADPGNKPVYDKLFKEYINIYKAMKGIYKRLNQH